MSLLTLPVEILAFIIRKLDTKSVYNLYEASTGTYIKDVIVTPNVVRECKLSMNTLATAKSLRSGLVVDISEHLKVLNLSAVSDLTASSLLPALENMNNLIDLDVSFTHITMEDSLDIIEIVPKLKSLGINFSFKKSNIVNEMLREYQQAFGSLKNVHFVGNMRQLLSSTVAANVVQKAKLDSLKFDVCDHKTILSSYNNDVTSLGILDVGQFQLDMFQFVPVDLFTTIFFSVLDLQLYEAILIELHEPKIVFTTSLLKKFIRQNFPVHVVHISNAGRIWGCTRLIIWNKEKTKFDNKFYNNLLHILKEYLVVRFDSNCKSELPAIYKAFYVRQLDPILEENRNKCESTQNQSKSMTVKRTLALNYDHVLKDKKDIKLKIYFSSDIKCSVTLRDRYFLKELSHLILYGDVKYTCSFFRKLFECCDSLVTLQITRRKGIPASPLQYMYRCKSLKNILLYVRTPFLSHIFNYLSMCRNLENIFLIDSDFRYKRCDSVVDRLPNLNDLFSKCDNLYNFSLLSFVSCDDKRKAMLKFIMDLKSRLGRDGLNVDLITKDIEYYSTYYRVFDTWV